MKEVAKLSEFSGNGAHRSAIDAIVDHKSEIEDGRLKGYEAQYESKIEPET